MKWDDAAVFAAVAEAGSFTAAGQRLGLPKSTVSRLIARLEAELGAPLLQRTTRRVRLTPAGQALLDRIGPLITGLDRALVHVGADDVPSGVLRVTTTPDLGAAVLPEVVAAFVTAWPEVRVETRFSFGVLRLDEGEADLALRAYREGPPDTPDLVARRIGSFELGLYASPRYVARHGALQREEDLTGHALLTFPGVPDALPGVRRVISDDVAFIRATCRAGGGVASLASWLVQPDVDAGELVRLLPGARPAWTGSVWVVTPSGRIPARTRVFRELLLAWLGRARLFGA